MAVGTTPLSVYQKEDVIWDFTLSDPNVSAITGWTIALKIKETASDLDPALVGPITCSITGTLTFRAAFNCNVPPGPYVYGVRRTDSGTSWELATGALTVLDTPSMDP
jgi:hypothetical protein